MFEKRDFDILVVGAGHAGVEAALAASRLGLSTALLTTDTSKVSFMSCNPSIGGLAKGHMVREMDILGAEMGLAADATCIQYKRLNSSRGPAVRGTRVQSDKEKYSAYMFQQVSNQQNLQLLQSEVKELLIERDVCKGVRLVDGSEVQSRAVILTTGTFMNGVMHVGLEQTAGGRVGEKATRGISEQLRSYGFVVRRLKTGTPARLLKDSIDWSKTVEQWGDKNYFPFSSRTKNFPALPQVACYLSRTTEETHDIIRKNMHLSPMYCGIIEGTGPRYCPSIEDKISRFADRTSHQTFLEPEGLDTDLIYLQGISTSLPREVQDQFLKTIPGLENVRIARYGYAVEYDFFEPTQILHRLETRGIEGLFLAGQINGTSGYEEAAAQGFVAGVNAALKILNRPEFILGRDQAYIGVLIDDLVTKGTLEPYRMFTSRAEHRLVLREDNTIDRLSSLSKELGLQDQSSLSRLSELTSQRAQMHKDLCERSIYPNEETQEKLVRLGSTRLLKSITFKELLRRPEISSQILSEFDFPLTDDPMVFEPVEIDVKYAGYISKQEELIRQQKKLENLSLVDLGDFSKVRGLSREEVEKLNRVKPRTLGQAQRISGVNPSAIQAIMIFLRSPKGSEKTRVRQSGSASHSVENTNLV